MAKWDDPDRQENLYDAWRVHEETGIGSEKKLTRRMRRAGLYDPETGEYSAPEGYDPNSFDPTTDEGLDSETRRRLRGDLRTGSVKGSLYRKAFDEARAELAKRKMDEFKEGTIDPMMGSVQETLQKLLSNPSFSPEELADMRGQLMSQARSQEANRLKRLGATLGMRGLDPGSVAGAALMNRVAEETDFAITDGLRQFNLDIADRERQDQTDELRMATDLGPKMAALEGALTSGNLEQVLAISNDIGAIWEALEARKNSEGDSGRTDFYGNIISGGIGAAGEILG